MVKCPLKEQRRAFLRRGGGVLAGSLLARHLRAQAVGVPAPTSSHNYEDFLPEEFYAELARVPIVYWGCGGVEEHGLHNALGVDLFTGYQVCLRAAKISGGIVYPPVPFTIAYRPPGLSRRELRERSRETFPPSLWIGGELCRQLYVELLESLADIGFKSCIAYSGHGPGDSLLQQIEQDLGGRVGAMRFWGGGTQRILQDHLKEQAKIDPLSLGHGLKWETSIAMALNRQWVDLPRAKRTKSHSLPSQLKQQPQERLDHIATANAELGNRILDLAAERAAKLAQEMLNQQKEK